MDQLVSIILQYGGPAYLLAAIFAYLYKEERNDRKAAEKSLHDFKDQFMERGFHAVSASADATKELGKTLETLSGMFRKAFFRLRKEGDDDEQDR